ncbi:MAG: protein translocase subunit SecD [Gemmatimonas sp.]|nr:protein translocase subunit SecD [Gemmatimonas sp.]
MLNDIRFRLFIIFGLVLSSGWVLNDRGIILGLDLRGGTHLALAIRDPAGALTLEQREDAIDRALRVIRSRIDELGVAEPSIQKAGRDRIVVELPGVNREQQQRAKQVIERAAFLEFQIVRSMADLQSALPRIDRAAAAVSAEAGPVGAPEGRRGAPTLELSPADPVAAGGSESAAAPPSEPGAQADSTRAFSDRLLPAGGGTEGIFLVAEQDAVTIERYLEAAEVQQALPRGVELRWGVPERAAVEGYRVLYLLDARELITGEHLVDARALRDPQLGQPIVSFEFNRAGGRIFEQGTSQNVGKFMAIVLDDRVMNAPIIQEAIAISGRIEMGGGSLDEARDLALVLRAGSLPVPIDIVEERSVGPSLGQDSIDRGQEAALIGLSFVVMIMLLYYRIAGVMAVAALSLYTLFVLGALAAIGAELTLPGIAGLILSIGMAVDANVLIFERIREELAGDQSPRAAVSRGFSNALSAIMDAQITTLLTAFVLHQFGTGPVRGFAVTLAIGIVASIFTAIFVTRTFFMMYLERRSGSKAISI